MCCEVVQHGSQAEARKTYFDHILHACVLGSMAHEKNNDNGWGQLCCYSCICVRQGDGSVPPLTRTLSKQKVLSSWHPCYCVTASVADSTAAEPATATTASM